MVWNADWWWYRVGSHPTFTPILILTGLRFSYNVEAMGGFLPVESFFSHVYVVDLSPSLCEVARQRFTRLGWKNVTVVCEDARGFRLPNSEKGVAKLPQSEGPLAGAPEGAADLVTMSYSLSMIPGMVFRWVAIYSEIGLD